jgi:hypothetical protein
MSSKELVFSVDRPLTCDMKTDIAIAWPFLLDGRVRLQLVIEAKITSCGENWAEARITRHQFRTRKEWELTERPVQQPLETPAPEIATGLLAPAFRLHA